MKRFLSFFCIIVFSIFLLGCDFIKIKPFDNSNDQGISLDTTITVLDKSKNYEFNQDEIDLYKYSNDELTSYVDIKQFMKLMSDGLVYYTIDIDETLVIKFGVISGGFDSFKIIFNHIDNTIYYENFDYALDINAPTQIDYYTNLNVIDYSKVEGSLEKTIDLNIYDIDILENDGHYYIPLYLANLILTGYNLNVYQNQNRLYIFDDIDNIRNYFSKTSLEERENEAALVDSTVNFTALIFDHFYGLKSSTGVESYTERFYNTGLYNIQQIEALDIDLSKYIISLDDLHTSIIDLGYYNDEMNISAPPDYSKISKVREELENVGANDKDYDIYFEETPDYYYLDIVSFNLETKDYLDNYFKNLDPEKDIYIDVSSNLGGNIIAIYELLAYMTNDPLNLEFINPSTNSVTKETYIIEPGIALENNFVVITSNATFSAANLFVSLVKEMNLATIIGRKTGGGACAVSVTILPNNMVICYSTHMQITNKIDDDLETGIEPNISVSVDKTVMDIYAILNNNIDLFSDYSIVSDSTSKDIYIDVTFPELPSNVSFKNITVKTYDYSGETIATYISQTPDFSYIKNYMSLRDYLRIEITIYYTYYDKDMEFIIFTQELDAMADEFTPDTLQISPETDVYGYSSGDKDYVILTIEETATYSVLIDDNIYKYHRIYDIEGNELGYGSVFTLDPGSYILEIDQPSIKKEYLLHIEKNHDDNSEGTELALQEGINSVSLTIDFIKDQEWVNLTVLEESLITISFDNVSTYFCIAYPNGERYNINSDYLSTDKEYTFILPKGEFLIFFYRDIPVSTFTITLDVSPVQNDYSGDTSLNDNNYGELVIGENYVVYDEKWDKDIYTFTTNESVDIIIDGNNLLKKCLITNEGLYCKEDNQIYSLEPGTHYFLFEYHNNTIGIQNSFTVSILEEQSNTSDSDYIAYTEPFYNYSRKK